MKRFLPTILIVATLAGVLSPFSFSLSKNNLVTTHTNVALAGSSTVMPYNIVDPYKKISESGGCGGGFGEFAVCMEYIFYFIPYWVGSQALFFAGKILDSFAAFTLSSSTYSASTFITQGWQITRDFSNVFFILILLYIAISLVLGIEIGHANPKKMLASVILIAIVINFSLFFTEIIIDTSNSLALIFYNQISVTAASRTSAITKTTKVLTSADQADADAATLKAIGVQVRPIGESLVQAFSPQFMYSEEFYKNFNHKVEKSFTPGGMLVGASVGLYIGSVIPIIGNAVGLGVGFALGAIHDVISYATTPDSAVDPQTMMLVFLVVGIMLCVSAYTLFVAAFAFIGRIIELWTAIIFAPFAFISSIIPGTRSISSFGWKSWSENLFSAAFSAPIFMFFLFIISLMSQSSIINYKYLANQNSMVILVTLVMPFLILTAMLLKAAKYVKKASGTFGEMFANLGLWAVKTVGGLALGAAAGAVAVGGQRTLGAVGRSMLTQEKKDLAAGNITDKVRALPQMKKFKNMDQKDILAHEDFLKIRKDAVKDLKTGRKLTGWSYDARHTQGAERLTTASGMSFGSFGVLAMKNTAGGVEGVKQRKAAETREFAEWLGSNHDHESAIKDAIEKREDKMEEVERTLLKIKADIEGFNNNSNLAKQKAQTSGNPKATVDEYDKNGKKTGNSFTAAEWKEKANLATYDPANPNAGKKALEKEYKELNDGKDTSKYKAGDEFTTKSGKKIKLGKNDRRVGTLKDQSNAAKTGDKLVDGQKVGTHNSRRVPSVDALGLKQMKSMLEDTKDVRKKSFFHSEMKESGYAVEHEKRDKLGRIIDPGHINLEKKGVIQTKQAIKEAFGAIGIGAGLGGAIAGPVGMVVGGAIGSLRGVLDNIREHIGNIDHRKTDIFGRTGQAEASALAADTNHKLHEFKSSFNSSNSPLNQLAKVLGSSFKSSGGGGGGGHSSGGGGGGHSSGGGGGHGGGHGGH